MNKKNRTGKRVRDRTLGQSQDYRDYSTDPADYQTWLDKIYSRLNLPTFVATLAIGLAVYLSGLLLATTFDFGWEYSSTSAIYVGVFGICLVSGVVRYSSTRIHGVFEYFRPCLAIDDDSYRPFIGRWFTRLADNTGSFLVAGAYGVLALLVAYSEFYLSPLTGRAQYGSVRPYLFEAFWYQPEDLWNKVIIILFYGISVALPLGTATRLLYVNFAFMNELKEMPVVPLIRVVRLRFRRILHYYTIIYLTWSVGIGLFGLVFFDGLSIDSIVFLSALNILGIGAFIAPQLCYRNFVCKSAAILTNRLLSDYHSTLQVRLFERMSPLRVDSHAAAEALERRMEPYVYDLPDVAIFIFAQIMVYCTTFLVVGG